MVLVGMAALAAMAGLEARALPVPAILDRVTEVQVAQEVMEDRGERGVMEPMVVMG